MDDVAFDRDAKAPCKHPMTTWHAGDSLSECFWFGKYCAFHSDRPIKRAVILHVTDGATVDVPHSDALVAAFMSAA